MNGGRPAAVVLAGDVGGTKSNLGLFEVSEGADGAKEIEGSSLRLLRSAKFANREFPDLAALLKTFLAAGSGAPVQAACFGVAGPVIANRSRTPNLAWQIDGAELAADLGIPQVQLINDLVATAEGIPLLDDDELAVLHHPAAGAAGSPNIAGNRVLLAAGTGLGMGLLPRLGDRWVAVPSEGGHADFPPRNELEIGLLLYLRERFGRVSIERVVSGPGLFNIYSYLLDTHYAPESPPVREALARKEDPARVIGESAIAGGCGLCAKALEIFVGVFAATAGNLALTGTATGGVYLGGGIAPKILPRLTDGYFLQNFLAKGRFVPYLERVPVKVILNDRAALFGAARHAASLRYNG